MERKLKEIENGLTCIESEIEGCLESIKKIYISLALREH